MILISAQPDDYYFLWQLELQLHNFKTLNIPKNLIHVLIGYDVTRGLSLEFDDFIKGNKYGTFFTYPDTRENKEYVSSIRPHLIKQHLKANPDINGTFFYHDSDILFREIPNFDLLSKTETWFVSDTRSYLDSKYIKTRESDEIFNQMCKIVGVDPALIVLNDINMGGAQYLIKNSSWNFWDKVEYDCERLYSFLKRNAVKTADIQDKKLSEYFGIDIWCADMWALAWNAIYLGTHLEVHEELDFCWPHDSKSEWYNKKILHYAGVTRGDSVHFYKGEYIHYSPFYTSLSHISNQYCSDIIKTIIEEYKLTLTESRIKLKDVVFILHANNNSVEYLAILKAHLFFIERFFDTTVILVGHWEESLIKNDPTFSKYRYIMSKSLKQNPREALLDFLRNNYSHKIIILLDASIIIPQKQIVQIINAIRRQNNDIIIRCKGDIFLVDNFFKNIFYKTLDPLVLAHNRNKFDLIDKTDWTEPLFMRFKLFEKYFSINDNPIDSRNDLFTSLNIIEDIRDVRRHSYSLCNTF